MRIATSEFNVRLVLGERFDSFWESFCASQGRQCKTEAVSWHWVLQEREKVPKSFAALGRADSRAWLQNGLARSYLSVVLSLRPDHGRVWVSEEIELKVIPKEMLLHVARKNDGGAAWRGPLIEIFNPLHQLHPGLAQHAVIGGVEVSGRLFAIVSDRPDPLSASLWQTFELLPETRSCLSVFASFDRTMQKEFHDCSQGAEISCVGIVGSKLTADQLLTKAGGTRKFAWKIDRNCPTPVIPATVRKFKLGEGLSAEERRGVSHERVATNLTRVGLAARQSEREVG